MTNKKKKSNSATPASSSTPPTKQTNKTTNAAGNLEGPGTKLTKEQKLANKRAKRARQRARRELESEEVKKQILENKREKRRRQKERRREREVQGGANEDVTGSLATATVSHDELELERESGSPEPWNGFSQKSDVDMTQLESQEEMSDSDENNEFFDAGDGTKPGRRVESPPSAVERFFRFIEAWG